jgi:iron(III) transport system permease protein
MTGRAAVASTQTKASPAVGLLCTALFVFITGLAVIPHLGVILMSFATDWYHSVLPEAFTLAHYQDALGNELTVPSIANSLKYASFSTLFDIVLGVAIAYVIVRTKIPGRGALDALSMLPLAVPGLVIAFGYLAMTREGQPFAFLLPGGNPTLILIIAYAVRRLPYVVRSAVAGFQQTGVDLEEAAQNLGASPLRALRRITIPLITANLIAGGLLAFSFAMLEVSDSLILAQQQEHYPITKAIYTLFSALGNGHFLASALGVWAMVFLAITIIGASLALGKKLGALFRV